MGMSSYKRVNIERIVCHVTGKYMFSGSLQPTDAQDDSNIIICRPLATPQSCTVCSFTSAFAGFANKITRLISFKLHSNIILMC